MSEVSAQKKFACPGCEAEALWNPAKRALVSPFCGNVAPMPAPPESGPAVIQELDLAAALQATGADQRGWQAEKKSV